MKSKRDLYLMALLSSVLAGIYAWALSRDYAPSVSYWSVRVFRDIILVGLLAWFTYDYYSAARRLNSPTPGHAEIGGCITRQKDGRLTIREKNSLLATSLGLLATTSGLATGHDAVMFFLSSIAFCLGCFMVLMALCWRTECVWDRTTKELLYYGKAVCRFDEIVEFKIKHYATLSVIYVFFDKGRGSREYRMPFNFKSDEDAWKLAETIRDYAGLSVPVIPVAIVLEDDVEAAITR